MQLNRIHFMKYIQNFKAKIPLFDKQHPVRGKGNPNQPCLVSEPQHHDYQTGAK